MKIERVDVVSCDGGWRNYHFLVIEGSDGSQGWSEFDGAYGPAGLAGVIALYGARLVGVPLGDAARTLEGIRQTFSPAPSGMATEVLGALDNALVDLRARHLGIPAYELLGGKVRSSIPVYWSHCASWGIGHPEQYKPAIVGLAGVEAAGKRALDSGFHSVKTNMFRYRDGVPSPWMSGFGSPYEPGLGVSKSLTRDLLAHLEALRRGVGDGIEVLIDLNFNARAEGFHRLVEALSGLDLFWIELDVRNAAELARIRQRSAIPIASCETLCGVREFLPFFEEAAVDVAIVDATWNGVPEAVKIAHLARGFDINIAPHNFYSHLATMMSVHFAAVVPNLVTMESDVDRLAWDDELFDHPPVIADGAIEVPDAPGWGIAPDLDALRAHPPRNHSFLGLD